MSWDKGYVTDVAYTTGYYPQQAPLDLLVACLMGNTMPRIARDLERLTYLELGCGRGRQALCLAASNPDWRVVAVDFMPAHIDEASEIAAAAGIGNVEFIEADIATFDPARLPDVDVASAHGLWSWVSDEVRAGIVRILGAKLRPGGVAHLSYNALPGWQSALGFQRLLSEAGNRSGGRSDKRAANAVELASALAAAGAVHLEPPLVKALLGRLPDLPGAYLAHEYMNVSWRPCFHADVAAALRAAKLDYVASGDTLENFPELMLTDAQRAVMDQLDDPSMRELAKDLCLSRSLRHDVFVRGARRISAAARDEALQDMHLTLTRRPEEFVFEANLPVGKASLERDFYEPVVAMLGEGPRSVRELLAQPGLAGRRNNPAELVGMLTGTDQAVVALRPAATPGDAANRLNEAMARRVLGGGEGRAGALASHRLGGGLRCGSDEFVGAWLSNELGPVDTGAWADKIGLSKGNEARERFLQSADIMRTRRQSIWTHAGVVA